MAYNPAKPSDTDLVKKSAELIRENFEGLRTEGIVFAKPPLYGAGAPKASVGENGDRYIDAVNGNHYYKNKSGQWDLNLSLDDKYKTIKDVKTIVEELQAMIAATEQEIGKTKTALKDLKDDGTVYNSEKFGLRDPGYYRCANGCSWTCSAECSGGCGNGCVGTCLAGCTGGCVSCTGTCSGSCNTACAGSCMNGCWQSCMGQCTGGCSSRD